MRISQNVKDVNVKSPTYYFDVKAKYWQIFKSALVCLQGDGDLIKYKSPMRACITILNLPFSKHYEVLWRSVQMQCACFKYSCLGFNFPLTHKKNNILQRCSTRSRFVSDITKKRRIHEIAHRFENY